MEVIIQEWYELADGSFVHYDELTPTQRRDVIDCLRAEAIDLNCQADFLANL
jgi:hypothetical protein